jgi:myo-inositol-1(or 4)-monophosphatase
MRDAEAMGELAAHAAVTGGAIVRAGLGSGRPAEDKGLPGDYVTEIDRASELVIREVLEEATPDVPVLGEEGGGRSGDRYWVVDPLDGTTNFVHGFWAVGVSVALVEGGGPVAGAVDAPLLGVTWVASAGGGTTRRRGDEAPVEVGVSERPPGRAVVGTGFPFRRKERVPRYLEAFRAAFGVFEDLRRPGAAALDLAWVADGTFDGFFELGLSPWDMAAGALLIREAGGVVTDWGGGDGWMAAGDILAGSPEVHAALRDVVGGDQSVR